MALSNAERQRRYITRLKALTLQLPRNKVEAQARALKVENSALKAEIAALRARLRGESWVSYDGGRKAVGHNDAGGDCTVRAIAVATGRPYDEVHAALTAATISFVKGKPNDPLTGFMLRSRRGLRSVDPAHGSYDDVYEPYLRALGWRYTSTKGRNPKVYLRAEDLPPGRLIVQVHRHLVAVIDGVVLDTWNSAGAGRRPVKGYWQRSGRRPQEYPTLPS
jgi:hypothetical protein